MRNPPPQVKAYAEMRIGICRFEEKYYNVGSFYIVFPSQIITQSEVSAFVEQLIVYIHKDSPGKTPE